MWGIAQGSIWIRKVSVCPERILKKAITFTWKMAVKLFDMLKRSSIAVNGIPSHSCGTSLAIWDHSCHPTQANAPRLNPSHAGCYSIYLPRRDGRLSWPSWLDSAPAGSPTSDFSIMSPTPNRCTTKTTICCDSVCQMRILQHSQLTYIACLRCENVSTWQGRLTRLNTGLLSCLFQLAKNILTCFTAANESAWVYGCIVHCMLWTILSCLQWLKWKVGDPGTVCGLGPLSLDWGAVLWDQGSRT